MGEVHQVSSCNPKDTFKNSVATITAKTRLERKPYVISLDLSGKNTHDITRAVFVSLQNDPNVPMRVRKGAAKWLAAKPVG